MYKNTAFSYVQCIFFLNMTPGGYFFSIIMKKKTYPRASVTEAPYHLSLKKKKIIKMSIFNDEKI